MTAITYPEALSVKIRYATGGVPQSDLLNDLSDLSGLLESALQNDNWLNAFLMAAGINQIVEDALHPDPLHQGVARKYLRRLPTLLGMPLFGGIQAIGAGAWLMHTASPRTLFIRHWQSRWGRLVEALAAATTGIFIQPPERLCYRAKELLEERRYFPSSLNAKIVSLPSSFRSFDQHPDDLECLADRFAQHWNEPRRPLLIVGVRSSGSYLAPLIAALMRQRGYQDVKTVTLRPGRRMLPSEKTCLRKAARAGALALLCDDPPTSGGSLVRVAKTLAQSGFRISNVILLLELFGDLQSLPVILQKYPSVLLPWDEWSIHNKLKPESVQTVMEEFLGQGVDVLVVERLEYPHQVWRREHLRALFRVDLFDRTTESKRTQLIFVEGAGIGYFGEHVLAVKRALPEHFPILYGLRDGLLYREGLDEENRLVPTDLSEESAVPEKIAAYISSRRQALAVSEDASSRLSGQNAVWEVASNLLSRVFRRGWPLARIPLVDPFVKALTQVKHPAVIDGNMGLRNWFWSDDFDGALLKTGFAERDFSHLDLACCDPIYDLAGAAVSVDDAHFSECLRSSYENQTGEGISPERWLIYRWVSLWDRLRLYPEDPTTAERAFSRLFQGYFAEIIFKDTEGNGAGPLCALDIDGVVETNVFPFSILTAGGAMALLALVRHGFRPILASGRSLGEVRERCVAYRLCGGVAEYGAAVYIRNTDRTVFLLEEAELEELGRLRQELKRIEGVYVDPEYRGIVRAYRLSPDGYRHGLSQSMIDAALEATGVSSRLQVIGGMGQTDFVPLRIDKGIGLRRLVSELGGEPRGEEKPVALAVGDTSSDLPMLAMAKLGFAPANANTAMRQAGVTVLSKPYQSGLGEAVQRLLGHPIGKCDLCHFPHLTPKANLLLELLSIQESGAAGMAWRTLHFGIMLNRALIKGIN